METFYTVIVGYCFLAVLWFSFVVKAHSVKNYMWSGSWVIFFPFTFAIFVVAAIYCMIKGFVEWLKRDF